MYHLPSASSDFDLPVQAPASTECSRLARVYLRYPGEGGLQDVGPGTGLMLSLHNWGGRAFGGTASPEEMASRFDVVVIGVDYFQSGPWQPGDAPYDFGWLQALDVLRALGWIYLGLKELGKSFASERLFAVGGSGGGYVSLMANKLAPRTFAVIVELSGMKKFDPLAYGPGGGINAGYSTCPDGPCSLTPDGRDLRDAGWPAHLAVMKNLGNRARIVSVHGEDDAICPFSHAEIFAQEVARAGLPIDFHRIGAGEVDGGLFADSGHTLGDRSRIVAVLAGDSLAPRAGTNPGGVFTDFDLRKKVCYETGGGVWIVDYQAGLPVGSFIRSAVEV